MRFLIFRSSDPCGLWEGDPEVREFGTLEELLDFAQSSGKAVILDRCGPARSWTLEIYDDWRE